MAGLGVGWLVEVQWKVGKGRQEGKEEVSRSTRRKYVDSPFGIFELKSFFTTTVEIGDGLVVSNRKVKKSLKELKISIGTILKRTPNPIQIYSLKS